MDTSDTLALIWQLYSLIYKPKIVLYKKIEILVDARKCLHNKFIFFI